jgi:4-hydroxy-tetrahydrodipicolinate synthase
MDPELLAQIAAENENVAAVKQANNDELGAIEGIDVLAGNDEILCRTLEVGGTGGILVASHLVGPEMRELFDAAAAGDLDRAHEIDARLGPIYEATSVTSNPIPVKAALEMLGIASGRVRLPLVEADEEQRAVIRGALERHGLLTAAAS